MKKYIIGISLIAAPSMVHASFWQDFFSELLKELSKPTPAPIQATIAEFCKQFEHDLKGFPQTDIDAIMDMTRDQLQRETNHQTITTDVATQYAKSAIAERYIQNVTKLINELYKPEDRFNAIASQKNNIHTRLQRISHINAESLMQFFDPQTIRDRITTDAQYKYGTSNLPTYYTQQQTHKTSNNQQVSSTSSYFNIDAFCTQSAYDLRGLSQKNLDIIVQKIKYQLQSEAQRHAITADIAMQYAKSVIAQHYQDVCTPGIEREYNQDDRQKAKESRYNNIHAFLSRNGINGTKLASFFDTNEIEKSIKKEADYKYGRNNNQQTSAPTSNYTPPVQQKPAIPTSTRTSIQDCSYNSKNTPTIDEVQRMVDAHDAELARIGMSENDRQDYRMNYWNQCKNKNLSIEALIKCSKQQIRRVLIENLNNEKSKLEPDVKNKIALRNVIEKVQGFIHSAVSDDSQSFNGNNIRKYIGKSMKDTLIEEMEPSISCSVCFGAYKDELKNGEAGARVNMPCNNGHHICSMCGSSITKCPECRVQFNKEQMQKNIQQAEQAFAANNHK